MQNVPQTQPPPQSSMRKLQPDTFSTDQTYVSRQIIDLIKIYNNETLKYSGERFDFLKKKLEIFYDFCAKIGIQSENYSRALSIMLSGKVVQFYYRKINCINDLTIKQAVDLIKQQFETSEVRQFYLNDWRKVTLQSKFDSYPEKSKLECFELMLNRLNSLQPGLSRSYRNDDVLRDQILVACQGIPECSYSLNHQIQSKEYVQICAMQYQQGQTNSNFNSINKTTSTIIKVKTMSNTGPIELTMKKVSQYDCKITSLPTANFEIMANNKEVIESVIFVINLDVGQASIQQTSVNQLTIDIEDLLSLRIAIQVPVPSSTFLWNLKEVNWTTVIPKKFYNILKAILLKKVVNSTSLNSAQ